MNEPSNRESLEAAIQELNCTMRKFLEVLAPELSETATLKRKELSKQNIQQQARRAVYEDSRN